MWSEGYYNRADCEASIQEHKEEARRRAEVMIAFADMEKPSAIVRVHRYHWMNKDRAQFWFICPGCKEGHAFNEGWDFNGDFEKPTFNPSLLCTGRKGCHPTFATATFSSCPIAITSLLARRSRFRRGATTKSWERTDEQHHRMVGRRQVMSALYMKLIGGLVVLLIIGALVVDRNRYKSRATTAEATIASICVATKQASGNAKMHCRDTEKQVAAIELW